MTRYRFDIDGRPAAPIRDTWDEAVRDAVCAGYAVRTSDGNARLSDQAEIARLK